MIRGFVKRSNHYSFDALPQKRTFKGFDPNAYKLLVKAGYNLDETSKLRKLPHEFVEKANHDLNPTQRMLMEIRYMVE